MRVLIVSLALGVYLVAGCSEDRPTASYNQFPTEYELAEMYEQINTDDWWFTGVYDHIDPDSRVTIRFAIPVASDFSLVITDRWQTTIVRNFSGSSEAGEYEIIWDLRDDSGDLVPPGIYCLTFASGGFPSMRKILITYDE